MAKSRVHPIDLPKVPEDFSVTTHLARAEEQAEGIRFFCRIIGETADERLLCETIDGVYEFRRTDVLSVKSVNSKRDLLIVQRQAPFMFHSTLARISRVEAERLRLKEAGIAAGTQLSEIEPMEVFDTVMFPGSHEWRGITG